MVVVVVKSDINSSCSGHSCAKSISSKGNEIHIDGKQPRCSSDSSNNSGSRRRRTTLHNIISLISMITRPCCT